MGFDGLDISVSGMLSSQVGLEVTGDNIANANTEGYSRKVVHFAEGNSVPYGGNVRLRTLSGVTVDSMERARNNFLDQQVRRQNSNFGFDEANSEIAISMNDILGEPSDAGITAKLNSFFSAASNLAANPELSTTKAIFINSADALAKVFNQIDDSISLLKSSLETKPSGLIPAQVTDLMDKLQSLAEVHQKVSSLNSRDTFAAELEDQRDLLLDQVSHLLNFEINRTGNSTFSSLDVFVHASEPQVTGTLSFSNTDSPITAITSSANTLVLQVDNGNGSSTGPFTVNFEVGSSIRDVVDKINKTFNAAGGQGSIASINENDKLVLQTSLIKDSENNVSAYVDINSSSTALAALGLSSGTTTGSDSTRYTVLDTQGLHYQIDYLPGSNEAGSNPGKLVLRSLTGTQPIIGYINNPSGLIGGFINSSNVEVPEMRQSLSDFAMSVKNSVNKILNLGVTSTGSQGQDLFSGTYAGNLQVRSTVLTNNSLIAQGETGAVGDGSIAQKVADLFFGTSNIIGKDSIAEKVYLDSSSSSSVTSKIAIIPGQSITINASGIIDDNASQVNAGTNNFGAGSLVQFEFLDASGAVIGSTNNFAASAGAPIDKVSYSGTVPATAAFIRFKMNSASFNDNDLTNNFGHFDISVIQGSDTGSATNLNTKIADIVGDFGTRGNLAESKKANSENLYNSLDKRRQSISGVSVEEEAAKLIQYQNAFSANARVISVWNQVYDDIVNII